MTKLTDWAESLVSRYEAMVKRSSVGDLTIGGPDYELYKLAQAILEDAGEDK